MTLPFVCLALRYEFIGVALGLAVVPLIAGLGLRFCVVLALAIACLLAEHWLPGRRFQVYLSLLRGQKFALPFRQAAGV